MYNKGLGDFMEMGTLGGLGDRNLSRGSSGEDVRELQSRLLSLGFDPNGVDGSFGPGTESAVKKFQASKGLSADGVVGPMTISALSTKSGVTQAEIKTSSNIILPTVSSSMPSSISPSSSSSSTPTASKTWVKPVVVGVGTLGLIGVVAMVMKKRSQTA